MARINVIQHDVAEGELKQIYDDLVKSRGKLAEVHKIQSLNPPTIIAHMDLYMSIMFSKSPLRRYQREMIAVITSQYNSCAYCVQHHREALHHFWKEDSKIDKLLSDYSNADISDKDKVFCKMAHYLTIEPDYEGKDALFVQLKENGASDREILDATLVISYFNFVNRLVLNLGVDLEVNAGQGYKYD